LPGPQPGASTRSRTYKHMHTTQTQANNLSQKSANKPTHLISSGAQMLVLPSRIFSKILWTNFLASSDESFEKKKNENQWCDNLLLTEQERRRERERERVWSSHRHRMCCRKFTGNHIHILLSTPIHFLHHGYTSISLGVSISDPLINSKHDLCG